MPDSTCPDFLNELDDGKITHILNLCMDVFYLSVGQFLCTAEMN